MEFYIYTPDLISLAFLIIILSAIYVRNRLQSNKRSWELIGHIKHIYVYPIEGCYGKEVKQVECTNFELAASTVDHTGVLWKDRKYLIYKDSPSIEEGKNPEESGKLEKDEEGKNLEESGKLEKDEEGKNPEESEKLEKDEKGKNPEESEKLEKDEEAKNPEESGKLKKDKDGEKKLEDIKQIILHNPDFVTIQTNILKNIQLGEYKDAQYPDGTISYICDCGYQMANVLTNMLGKYNNFRLGYQNKYVKLLSFKSRQLKKFEGKITNPSCLNPEFSLCSLVNEESVKDIKGKSGNDQLTHSDFRPNFVISADKYCEDKIEFLKIGSVEFFNVLPCVVDEYVNIDPEDGTISHDGQPFLTLSETRKLKDVRPDISTTLDMPVFGITLDVLPSTKGKISVGDKVYAKFFKRT